MAIESFADLVGQLHRHQIDRRQFLRQATALGFSAAAIGGFLNAARPATTLAQSSATPAGAAATGYEWVSVGPRTVQGEELSYEFADRQVLVSQAGPAELEFWTINLRGPYGNWIEGFLQDYQDVNQGVQIQWVDVPGAEVAQAYLVAVSAGQAPDVANIYEMPRFIELGALAGIDEYLPAADQNDFFAPFWDGLTLDGQTYAFPWYTSTGSLVYSRVIMEEAGLDPNVPPTTWDEAMAMSRTITDTTGKYGLLMTVGQGELVQLLQQAGVSLVSAEGTSASLNTPEAVALFDQWRTFYKDGYLPPEGTTANPRDSTQWYYAGRGAFVPGGVVVTVRRADPAVLEQWDTDVAASLKGTTGQAVAQVQYHVVSATSDNIQAAVDLGAFVTGTGLQIEFITQVPILPTRQSVTADPEFRANFIENEATGRSQQELLDRGFQLSLAELDTALLDFNATPTVVGWARMYDLFNQETNRMFATDQSAADTLSAIEQGWNEILAEGA
jgi:putative chitobiose transport system substrate-binding protein